MFQTLVIAPTRKASHRFQQLDVETCTISLWLIVEVSEKRDLFTPSPFDVFRRFQTSMGSKFSENPGTLEKR